MVYFPPKYLVKVIAITGPPCEGGRIRTIGVYTGSPTWIVLKLSWILDVDIVLVETILGVEETDYVAEGIVLETVETFLDVDQIVHSLPDLCTDHSDQETEVLTFSNSVYHCNWCSCCQSSLSSTFYSLQCLYPSL